VQSESCCKTRCNYCHGLSTGNFGATELKRILSFDGGGIRGIFSLQVAAKVEHIFREVYGRADLVLADVIDLFAGTSTGAIIATCLAWGYPVAEVEQLYLTHGRQMFARQRLWHRYRATYRAESLAELFRHYFREDDGSQAELGSQKLRKLLLVVMANATTGSPWPVTNNPSAIYNQRERDDCNLRIPLWQLLRACTAAPFYFQPEAIRMGDKTMLFVDGGVTPYNNPAMLAVLMATLPCYKLQWPTGPEKLHLISIGTGRHHESYPHTIARKIYLWRTPGFMIREIMATVGTHQDLMCRIIGRCLHGAHIDTEIGSLDSPTLLPGAQQKFSYVRYNVALDSTVDMGTPMTPLELQFDNLKSIRRLQEIGRAYAERTVLPDHLTCEPGLPQG
jgi:hypothetical protein